MCPPAPSSAEARRSPHGERGLKLATYLAKANDASSLPTRGAWIEMSALPMWPPPSSSRSPHGERGLKLRRGGGCAGGARSLPTRGAWIEIMRVRTLPSPPWESLPTRGAWIEIPRGRGYDENYFSRSPHGERGLKCSADCHLFYLYTKSLPTRGAWISYQLRSLMRKMWV